MSHDTRKRSVFISYFGGDQEEVDAFVKEWAWFQDAFTSIALGTFDNEDFIDSTNTEYVMSQIRRNYLRDSTVTIVLIGSCTHSRRYVDWEIKASLRQGDSLPNGLLGILLASARDGAALPPRFAANWERSETNCYARWRHMPTSVHELRAWIEDAFAARTERAHLIQNSHDMMHNNARCKRCGVTH